jgi:hypothetical protein
MLGARLVPVKGCQRLPAPPRPAGRPEDHRPRRGPRRLIDDACVNVSSSGVRVAIAADGVSIGVRNLAKTGFIRIIPHHAGSSPEAVRFLGPGAEGVLGVGDVLDTAIFRAETVSNAAREPSNWSWRIAQAPVVPSPAPALSGSAGARGCALSGSAALPCAGGRREAALASVR